jgi:hypothetical protein
MDSEWAKQKLHAYADLTARYIDTANSRAGVSNQGGMARALDTASRITQRLGLGPLSTDVTLAAIWANRATALRAVGLLEDQEEVDAQLGPVAPVLSAGHLHPRAWGAAQQLWESGHHREAVEAAARSVNGRVQQLVTRRDVSDNDLINQAFSTSDPAKGAPRLRVPGDWESKIVRGQQQALRDYAAGCFGVIRNPAAHDEDEWPEQYALERLAALSVLAHEIEKTTVVRAED